MTNITSNNDSRPDPELEYISTLTKEDIINMSLNHNTIVPDIQPIVTIGDCIFAAKGSFSLIVGTTGTGKSTIIRKMIVATLIDQYPNSNTDTIGIQASPAGNDYVIYINTEMSNTSTMRKIHNAVLKDLGIREKPSNFLVLNLIANSPSGRRAIIRQTFEMFPNIHLLIIDGGADTVSSVNDEVGSNEACEELNIIANKNNTAIINVIHVNKGNGLTRGHYGQAFERKAFGIMVCTYDANTKTHGAHCNKARESAYFENIGYRYDEYGDIYQVDKESMIMLKKDSEPQVLKQLVEDCFKDREIWKRSELVKYIADVLEINVNNARTRVTKMIEKAYIRIEEKNVRCLLPIERSTQAVFV